MEPKKEKNIYIMGWVIISGYFGFVVAMMVLGVHESAKDTILLVSGVLVAKFGTVVDFFFGTSSSSNEKTALIGKLKR